MRCTPIAALVLCASWLAPPAAGAATLSGTGGTLAYVAGGGQRNGVEFSQTAPATVRVVPSDTDPITASGTCAEDPGRPGEYECTGIRSLVAEGGDGADALRAAALTTIPARLAGGAGSDFATGGGAADTLDGGADDDRLDGGPGDDTLRGDGGNDLFLPGAGADGVSGGDGFDRALVSGSDAPAPDVSVTLDDVADDGLRGEGDDIRSDVEDVSAETRDSSTGAPGAVRIAGSAAANILAVDFGRGTLDGGAGNDLLLGGRFDDTIEARDGFADRVRCSGGADTADVDTLDVVSGDCETVRRQDVGVAGEDRPPTVAFTAPADRAALGAGGTTLTATASDDEGVAMVRFLDDERIVCEDTTAPYSCDHRPRGEDVGRNTLVAVATDTSAQTATALRSVTVRRFAPRAVTLRVAARRGSRGPRRLTVSGVVRLPARVGAAEGCRGGAVAVRVTAGRRTIAGRRAALREDCSYRRGLTLRRRAGRVLRVTARYPGNAVLRPGRSKTVTLRR